MRGQTATTLLVLAIIVVACFIGYVLLILWNTK